MAKADTNKKSHAGRNVLVFFIVFIILEMLIIFGIGKVFKNPDVTPSIAGYSLYMTKNDLKMKDDNGQMVVAIPKDVLIIAANGVTDAKSKIGNAVLCEKVPGVESGMFWLVSVEAKENQDGVFYRVWDTNKYYDLRSTNVVGFAGSYFVTAGKVIRFVTNKFGMIVCAVVPLFLLVLLELIIAIATSSPEEEEDEDDEDEEEEEKDVQLDDFLFGGQSEGEQIARHRREQAQADQAPQRPLADTRPVPVPEEKAVRPAPEAPKAAPVTEVPAEAAPVQAAAETVEKAAETAEKAAEAPETAKPAEEAPKAPRAGARRPAQGQRRRRPTTASEAGVASLEELSKLIEEQQARLKDQLK